MLLPPHSLHILRCRPCSHRLLPPHSLHILRCRPCSQRLRWRLDATFATSCPSAVCWRLIVALSGARGSQTSCAGFARLLAVPEAACSMHRLVGHGARGRDRVPTMFSVVNCYVQSSGQKFSNLKKKTCCGRAITEQAYHSLIIIKLSFPFPR